MSFRRISLGLVAVLLIANLAIAAKIYSTTPAAKEKDDPYDHFKTMAQVMEMIRANYVDGEKVSYRDMSYNALKGMLGSLDPHSQFMEPQNYEDLQDETEGKFGGIGVVVNMSRDGYLAVVAPMDGTPGARAGLLPGDRIIKIDGKLTEKMNLQEAVHNLRGEIGSKVVVTIYRSKAKESADRLKDFTIERAEIKVDSVKDVKMLDDHIGYVRIVQFNAPTAEEFEKALQKLEAQKMEALIIDLRNNPGGLLDSAIRISSKFIPRGDLIVSTEGRDPRQITKYRSTGSAQRRTYPIVILTNPGSASASEIVAGALQDVKRAVLVGETTFGKGSVQSILKLPDGSALRLTTAKYYTPSHKVIHEHGVVPDILVPVTEEDEMKLAMQRAREGLPPTDSEKLEAPIRDVQLDRAIDVLKGVKLFARQAKVGAPK